MPSFPLCSQAAYFIMKMNFYEEMAVRVNITTVSCFSKWSVVVGGLSVSVCAGNAWPHGYQPFITQFHC